MDEIIRKLVREYVETGGDDWETEHRLALHLFLTGQSIELGYPATPVEIHRWIGLPEGLQEFSGLYELHHACGLSDLCMPLAETQNMTQNMTLRDYLIKHLIAGGKMTLRDYLIKHLGEEIPKLKVTSALGTPGTVEVVTWAKFPESSCFKGEIDEECSWVSIKWSNGNYSDQTVDLLNFVKIAE